MTIRRDPMGHAIAAQQAQVQQVLAQTRAENEMLRRCVVSLVRGFRGDIAIAEVEGHAAIHRADYEAVPGLFELSIRPVEASPAEGGEGEGEPALEQLMLVEVKRVGGNGGVEVVDGPKLVLPS